MEMPEWNHELLIYIRRNPDREPELWLPIWAPPRILNLNLRDTPPETQTAVTRSKSVGRVLRRRMIEAGSQNGNEGQVLHPLF
jgi:hypothetical protein